MNNNGVWTVTVVYYVFGRFYIFDVCSVFVDVNSIVMHHRCRELLKKGMAIFMSRARDLFCGEREALTSVVSVCGEILPVMV